MAPFEPGINKGILGFVPGTHQLLFETFLCQSQEFESPCSTTISLADTGTGEIRNLADPGLALQRNSIPRNVVASPNGKMVALGTMDGVEILALDGSVVRHNVLPYEPNTPTILFPSLFWLPDSSGLIVALPNTTYHSLADGDLSAHTVWHYTIGNNQTVEIPLDPTAMLYTFQVSPDGHWIVYGGLANNNSVYLGNLEDGHVQAFGYAQQSSFSWSPGSKYFIYTDLRSTLGTIDDPPNPTLACYLMQWIDANHFTCFTAEEKASRVRVAKIEIGESKCMILGWTGILKPLFLLSQSKNP